MKRSHLVAGTLVIALAAFMAAITTTSSAASPRNDGLTVVAKDSEATFAPEGFFDTPLQPNGQVTEDAPVYRDKEEVGSAQTILTITRAKDDDIAGIIECSVELPEGNLFFNGSVHLADLGTGADVPVVGGTGAYAGFRGVVTMTASEDGSETTLSFQVRKP